MTTTETISPVESAAAFDDPAEIWAKLRAAEWQSKQRKRRSRERKAARKIRTALRCGILTRSNERKEQRLGIRDDALTGSIPPLRTAEQIRRMFEAALQRKDAGNRHQTNWNGGSDNAVRAFEDRFDD